MNQELPRVGEIWKHYKHDPSGAPNNYHYKIIGIALDTESEIPLVIYQPLYVVQHKAFGQCQASFYARSASMFLEHVTKLDYLGPKFIRIS